jgi:hypothetical protein
MKVATQAKQTYVRDPCIAHRIRYVHTSLLSKVWYAAQVLPELRSYTKTALHYHYVVHL